MPGSVGRYSKIVLALSLASIKPGTCVSANCEESPTNRIRLILRLRCPEFTITSSRRTVEPTEILPKSISPGITAMSEGATMAWSFVPQAKIRAEINVQENLRYERDRDTIRVLGKIDRSSTFEEEKERCRITSSNRNRSKFVHSVLLASQRSINQNLPYTESAARNCLLRKVEIFSSL